MTATIATITQITTTALTPHSRETPDYTDSIGRTTRDRSYFWPMISP